MKKQHKEEQREDSPPPSLPSTSSASTFHLLSTSYVISVPSPTFYVHVHVYVYGILLLVRQHILKPSQPSADHADIT